MDAPGAVYMLIGHKHGVQLLVSVYSLREMAQYHGRVCLLVGCDASERIANQINCKALGPIEVKRFPHQPRRNGAYAAKTRIPERQPFDRFMYYDCDTTFTGQPMIGLGTDESTVHLTQFCEWVSTGKIVGGRIKKWQDEAPGEVARMLSAKFKAINTGVLAGPREHSFWPAWAEMCERRPRQFIVDEIAAQLVFPDHEVRVLDDTWNFSPRFSNRPKDDIKIIHYHGRKHVRDGKPTWMPIFKLALKHNIGNVREWGPAADPATFDRYNEWLDEKTYAKHPEEP